MFSFRSETSFRPWQWTAVFVAVLIGDYLTGPFLHSAILLYFVPIGMAAWSGALWWSLALATLWPALRLGIEVLWHVTWPWKLTLDDTVLNWIVSLIFASLLWYLVRQERKLRVLQGMLPICGFCKRIRNGPEWQQMEQYITEHSEARFSHTFCPECGERHYGEYLRSPHPLPEQ
ncbi:MAG TPA: hypothetical protein VJU17_09730 [Gemmatimonadales bacterium]|nr:hypothetical protein [Gemmatimonadales bacterium]